MAGRHRDGRAHRRRLSAREPGAGTDRIAAEPWLRQAGRDGNQGRGCSLQPAHQSGAAAPIAYNFTQDFAHYFESMSPSLQIADARVAACAQALRRAAAYLLGRQEEQGFWIADLTADTTLESDYVLLELWRHPPSLDGVWNPPSHERIAKAVRSILARQLPDGGFNIYAEGPSEINASIKAYTALKLGGLAENDPHLTRLRDRILEMGGMQAATSYVKVNLSLFNLFPRHHTPTILPELMLLG